MLGSHRGKGYSRTGVGASRSCCRRHRLWAPHKDDLGQVSSPTVCLGSAEPRRRMRRAKDSSTSWGQAETVRRSGTRPASASQVCKAQAVSNDMPKASLPPSPPQTWLQGTEQFQSASRPPPSSHTSSPLSGFSPTSATLGFQAQYQQSPWGPQRPPSHSMGN